MNGEEDTGETIEEAEVMVAQKVNTIVIIKRSMRRGM